MADETRQIARIQRNLGIERPREAKLGDDNGVVFEPGKASHVRVTYITSSGEGWPQTVRRSLHSMAYRTGLPVLVYYDPDIQDYRVKPNDLGMESAGMNPFLNDVADDLTGGFVDLAKSALLYSAPTTPPSLSVTVKSLFYIRGGVAHLFEGSGGVDLTASIPATSGEHGLIGLFLKTDDTIEIITGTAKSAVDEFTLADVQELVTGATAGSLPVGIWTLYNGQPTISDQDRFGMDPRQFLNVTALHADLPDLQGGTAGEYYHLTAAEYAALGGGGGDRPVFRWLGV